LVISDKPLNDLGPDAGFVFPHEIAIEFSLVVFVAIIDRNFKTGDGMAPLREAARVAAKGVKPGCPAASDRSGWKRSLAKSRIGARERKFAVISIMLAGSCARSARFASR
jgi:hypothetical protein